MANEKRSTGLMKLFEDQLADLYYVEKQLTKAIPKMMKAAQNGDLQAALEGHLEETKEHVTRLESIFELIGKPAKAKKCPAIDGILEEGKEIMEEFSDDPALDAGIVSAGQKVEHYEMSSYGCMAAWAEQLGMDDALELINMTLNEEKAADEKLSMIAEDVVNIEADVDGDENGKGGSKKPTSKNDKAPAAKKRGMAKA
ncbi:MAG: ferritin-like domain-containing protein [Flavobacteriales bacterium]